MDVFGLEIGDLVDDLDQGARNRLRQIPDVASHFNRQKALIIGNRRRWLFISALLVAFGAVLIYAGTVHLVGSDTIYIYTSPGIVLEGERKEIFREQGRSQPILERVDRHFLQTRRYRGEMFNIPVDGGSRTYYYELDRRLPQWQNKGVAALGVLLLSFGTIGIILERKLSLYQ